MERTNETLAPRVLVLAAAARRPQMSRGLPCPFNVGDWVYDVVDPRHVGRIVLIDSGLFARIEWRKNLVSEALPIKQLRKVPNTNI
jgi:hypothetical protein